MENVKQTERLNEYRSKILKEIPMVDVKPYSHNIISLLLRGVCEKFGDDESDAIIRQYGLDKMGWECQKDLNTS